MLALWIILGLVAAVIGIWAMIPLFARPTIKAWRYTLGALMLWATFACGVLAYMEGS